MASGASDVFITCSGSRDSVADAVDNGSDSGSEGPAAARIGSSVSGMVGPCAHCAAKMETKATVRAGYSLQPSDCTVHCCSGI